MTVTCPECQTIYRIDPDRVPAGGTRARCSACGAVMAIGLPSTPAAWMADAGPVDPAIVSASDAAAAPDVWDWFPLAAGGAGAPSHADHVDATAMPVDDLWAEVWGEAPRTGPTVPAEGSATTGAARAARIHAAGPASAVGPHVDVAAAPPARANEFPEAPLRRTLPHPPAVSPRPGRDDRRG